MKGVPEKMLAADMPVVVVSLVSSGLRRINWIRMSLLIRLRISACSGVTRTLTTCTVTGLPSASF